MRQKFADFKRATLEEPLVQVFSCGSGETLRRKYFIKQLSGVSSEYR